MEPTKMDVFVCAVLSAIIGCLLGLGLGDYGGAKSVRQEAVKAGAAKWVPNPADGSPEFKWNVEAEKK